MERNDPHLQLFSNSFKSSLDYAPTCPAGFQFGAVTQSIIITPPTFPLPPLPPSFDQSLLLLVMGKGDTDNSDIRVVFTSRLWLHQFRLYRFHFHPGVFRTHRNGKMVVCVRACVCVCVCVRACVRACVRLRACLLYSVYASLYVCSCSHVCV